MSSELDLIDGSGDIGVNWSGRFRILVDSKPIIGKTTFTSNLNVSEEDILDTDAEMPIGKSLNTRSINYSITIKNLSGGNANDPESSLEGNYILITKALANEQFDLEIIERNLKQGRSDWMFRTFILKGCTHRGNLPLVNIRERGGPPDMTITGTALSAILKVGTKTYIFTGLR